MRFEDVHDSLIMCLAIYGFRRAFRLISLSVVLPEAGQTFALVAALPLSRRSPEPRYTRGHPTASIVDINRTRLGKNRGRP
jgi:hypothetical protein